MAQEKRPTKKRKKTKKTKRRKQQQEQMLTIGVGFTLILFAVFGFLELGFLGILIVSGFWTIVRNTYQILCPLLAVLGFWVVIRNTKFSIGKDRRWFGGILFYFGILLLLHARLFGKFHTGEPDIIGATWDLLASDIKQSQVDNNVGGGMIGAILYHFTHFLIAQPGSYLVAILLLANGAFLFSNLEDYQLLNDVQSIEEWVRELLEGDPARRAQKQAAEEERMKQRAEAREAGRLAAQEAAEKEVIEYEKKKVVSQQRKNAPDEWQEQENAEPEQLSFVLIDSFQENIHPVNLEKPVLDTSKQTNTAEGYTNELPEDDGTSLELEIEAEQENQDYELPTVDLLDSIPTVDQSDRYKKIEKNIGVSEQTSQSFGVDAKVAKASLGPSVTKFGVQPAIGVKVGKIVDLADDITLVLATKDVRMETPIPGESLIGIEVPNGKISMVSFREIIEAQPNHPGKLLEVPLGRDVSGRV